MDNIKTVAEKLSVVLQGLYADGFGMDEDIKSRYNEMTDNGKKPIFVFGKNKEGRLEPFETLTTFNMPWKEPENTPLEQVSSRLLTKDEVRDHLLSSMKENETQDDIETKLNKIMKDNAKRYKDWEMQIYLASNAKEIYAGTSKNNAAAEAYAKQLNNEELTEKDRISLKAVGIGAYPKMNLEDIRSGRAFMGFLEENKDSVNLSNICINGVSLKDYFGSGEFTEQQADIVAGMFRNMTDMHKLAKAVANPEDGKNPFGTSLCLQ